MLVVHGRREVGRVVTKFGWGLTRDQRPPNGARGQRLNILHAGTGKEDRMKGRLSNNRSCLLLEYI